MFGPKRNLVLMSRRKLLCIGSQCVIPHIMVIPIIKTQNKGSFPIHPMDHPCINAHGIHSSGPTMARAEPPDCLGKPAIQATATGNPSVGFPSKSRPDSGASHPLSPAQKSSGLLVPAAPTRDLPLGHSWSEGQDVMGKREGKSFHSWEEDTLWSFKWRSKALEPENCELVITCLWHWCYIP